MTSIANTTHTTDRTTGDVTAPPDLPNAFDLLLRGQKELDRQIEDPRSHGAIIRKLLLLSVLGLVGHGFVVGLSIQLFGSSGALRVAEVMRGPVALWLPVAFVIALIGALSICLPSFYFYTQLAGLDASFRLVTVQALRVQATTSVFLFGALPIFLALALTSIVTEVVSPELVVLLGLGMPFVVGLTGVKALFTGFRHMLTYVEITHERRGRFLLRLLVMWAGVYTVVAPVAVYRAAERLASLF